MSADIASIADTDTDSWDKIIKVNLYSVYYALKYELQAMLENGGGGIVNTSSTSGLYAVPGISPYVASKHAVNGITKAAAVEYADKNIRVNSISPGATDTPMMHAAVGGRENLTPEVLGVPMGRMGTPEEQANTAVWLCSDQASYISGVNLLVDGAKGANF